MDSWEKNKDAKIGFSEIRSKIYIKSSSSKEDIEKFIEFIDRTCPVADTLKKFTQNGYRIKYRRIINHKFDIKKTRRKPIEFSMGFY